MLFWAKKNLFSRGLKETQTYNIGITLFTLRNTWEGKHSDKLCLNSLSVQCPLSDTTNFWRTKIFYDNQMTYTSTREKTFGKINLLHVEFYIS